MAKSIDFVTPTVVIDKSGFSESAKAAGWHTATENLCKALAKVLDTAKRLNDYERQDAICATYDGLYGADELCFNLLATNRRKRDASSTYSSYSNSGGFYLTAYQMATKMWGLTTSELPVSRFYTLPYDSTTSTYLQYYQRIITALEASGVMIDDYWKIERLFPEDTNFSTSNITMEIEDETSFFNGSTLKTGYNSNYIISGPMRWFGTIANIRGHLCLLKIMMDNTPTGSRGGKTFSASYSTRDCLYSFPQFQPHDLIRIRQALTEVRAGYTTYDIYSPGTATNSITSGRIGNRIKKALSNRGITFATSEISDKTLDISDYYSRATYINDPLILAAAGFAGIESTTDKYWTRLVPAVHLCRKYLMRCYAVAYDYKETTNPNAFEKEGGKVNYKLSNSRVFTNSLCTYANDWKVKTHEYDEYYTTNQYTYLKSISDILRANIAKAALGFNRCEQKTDITSDYGGISTGFSVWAFLPTLTMLGIANRSSVRRWTNFQLAVDNATYIDESGDTYPAGYNYEAGLGDDDSVAFEEPDVAVDLLENAWELGNRRYQFKVNPECSDASTERDKLYIPTSTPGIALADTRDATIPNRVACLYLAKADGTATTASTGASSPYNYNPSTYAFTLVPFHTAATDNVKAEFVSEPILSYKATAFTDL